MICRGNQLNGFYMMAILVFNKLIFTCDIDIEKCVPLNRSNSGTVTSQTVIFAALCKTCRRL